MTHRNPTKAGRIKLGGLIRESLEERGMTQKDLIDRLTVIGHDTTKDKVSRLVNAVGAIDALLLLSIADLGICQSPQGSVYSIRDLLLIACEDDPKPSLSRLEINPAHPASPLGIVLLSEIEDQCISVAEFARRCDLDIEVLEAILRDQSPLLSDKTIEAIAAAIASIGLTPEGVKKLYVRSQPKAKNGRH